MHKMERKGSDNFIGLEIVGPGKDNELDAKLVATQLTNFVALANQIKEDKRFDVNFLLTSVTHSSPHVMQVEVGGGNAAKFIETFNNNNTWLSNPSSDPTIWRRVGINKGTSDCYKKIFSPLNTGRVTSLKFLSSSQNESDELSFNKRNGELVIKIIKEIYEKEFIDTQSIESFFWHSSANRPS